jgi:hypothetical protein
MARLLSAYLFLNIDPTLKFLKLAECQIQTLFFVFFIDRTLLTFRWSTLLAIKITGTNNNFSLVQLVNVRCRESELLSGTNQREI